MTEDQHRFVEDMGQHMVGYGVPRNTGRVYGYLLLQTRPAGLDEITSELEMAKSGASVATRQLVGFGLARGIGERGSRRLLYEAVHELEGILAARDAQVADLLAKLRQGARAAAPGRGQERLAEMAEMLQELVGEIPALVARIRLRRQT